MPTNQPRINHTMLTQPELRERAYIYALSLTRNREDATELTQEALYRAVKAENDFDRRRAPEPWVKTILRNA